MKYLITGMLSCCLLLSARAQHTLKVKIVNIETKLPLPGATMEWTAQKHSSIADVNGIVFFNKLPAGSQQFLVSHIGFEERILTFNFPLPDTALIEIDMQPEEEEMEEEVVVSATRLSLHFRGTQEG